MPMISRIRNFRLLALLIWLIPSSSALQASPDDLQAILASDGSDVFDWDPAGFAAPRLAEGEVVSLHLASDQALRVAVRAEAETSGELHFWVSQGQGLRMRVQPRVDAGAYVLPAAPEAQIVRILRPDGAGRAVSLQIATGRYRLDDAGVDYSTPVALPGPIRSVIWQEPRHQLLRLLNGPARSLGTRRQGQERRQDYVLAQPGQVLELEVTGPQRLRLETRLLPEGAENFYRSYRIDWKLDDRAQTPLEFEASWDLRRVYRWSQGGEAGVTGAQRGYVNVPAGQHRLSFRPSRAMLLRADALGGRLVAPRTNANPELGRALAELLATTPRARSDVTWGALGGQAPDIDTNQLMPNQLEELARDLARTNTVSGGGLQAADLLRIAATARPAVPDIATSAERFAQAYGIYRQLQPLRFTPAALTLWDSARVLDEPAGTTQTGPSAAVPEAVLLSGLNGARFHALTTAQHIDYQLTEQSGVTRLRVMVARKNQNTPLLLSLQADGHRPIMIELARDDQLGSLPRRPSNGDLGLLRLAEKTGRPADELARIVLRARGLPGAQRSDIATIDLTLDHPVSRLRLRAVNMTGTIQHVAVTERVSRPARLDPPAFLAVVAQLGRHEAQHLFSHALKGVLTCESWTRAPDACGIAPVPGDRTAQTELYNSLVPVLRLLRSRERLVFDTVRGTPAIPTAALAAQDIAQAERLILRGNDWQKDGHPLAALEDFAGALAVAPPPIAAQALGGQAKALEALGEAYLPDRLLRRAALDCDGPLGSPLRAQLVERYRNMGDSDRQIGVMARRVHCADRPTDLVALVTLLARDGRDEAALQLGALSRVAEMPELEGARTRTGWPSATLPSALTDSHTLDISALVLRAAGAIPVRVETRDLVDNWYRGTEDRPVVINVPEDGLLELTVRPLLFPGSAGLGSAVIKGAGQSAVRTFARAGASTNLTDLSGVYEFGFGENWQGLVSAGEQIVIRPSGIAVAIAARLRPGVGLSSSATPEAELYRLSALTDRYIIDPLGNPGLLVDAARISAPLEGLMRHHELRPLWARIRSQSRWARVIRVASSAGVTEVESPGLPFDSPTLRTRATLAENFDPTARTVQADSVLLARNRGGAPTAIPARLTLVTLPAIDVPDAALVITDPHGTELRIEFGADRRNRELILEFPAGEAAYRFRLEAPVPNAFLQLKLDEASADASLFRGGNRRRTFEVATAEEPVVYVTPTPVVLRVDEWRDGRLLSRLLLASPEAPLVLRPAEGEQRALFRLFRLDPDPSADSDIPAAERNNAERVPRARAAISDDALLSRTFPQTLGFPDQPSGQQTVQMLPGRPGTWSFGTALSQVDQTEEGVERRLGQLQTSARYRRYWPGWDVYSDVEALARQRETGPTVLGMDGTLTWPSRAPSTTYLASFGLRGQQFDRLAWRANLAFEAERDFVLSETLDLSLLASLSLSELSHGNVPSGRADAVDASVYSDYLRDHPSAFQIGAQLDWRPYEDLQFYTGLGLRSNKLQDVLDLESARIEAGFRHYFGGLRSGIDVSHQVFLADTDRAKSVSRSEISLDAAWDQYRGPQGRLEIGSRLRYRSDIEGARASIYLTWHTGGGFEDMASRTVGFQELREDARTRWLQERYGK